MIKKQNQRSNIHASESLSTQFKKSFWVTTPLPTEAFRHNTHSGSQVSAHTCVRTHTHHCGTQHPQLHEGLHKGGVPEDKAPHCVLFHVPFYYWVLRFTFFHSSKWQHQVRCGRQAEWAKVLTKTKPNQTEEAKTYSSWCWVIKLSHTHIHLGCFLKNSENLSTDINSQCHNLPRLNRWCHLLPSDLWLPFLPHSSPRLTPVTCLTLNPLDSCHVHRQQLPIYYCRHKS